MIIRRNAFAIDASTPTRSNSIDRLETRRILTVKFYPYGFTEEINKNREPLDGYKNVPRGISPDSMNGPRLGSGQESLYWIRRSHAPP